VCEGEGCVAEQRTHCATPRGAVGAEGIATSAPTDTRRACGSSNIGISSSIYCGAGCGSSIIYCGVGCGCGSESIPASYYTTSSSDSSGTASDHTTITASNYTTITASYHTTITANYHTTSTASYHTTSILSVGPPQNISGLQVQLKGYRRAPHPLIGERAEALVGRDMIQRM
jgi:hypothetical protein